MADNLMRLGYRIAALQRAGIAVELAVTPRGTTGSPLWSFTTRSAHRPLQRGGIGTDPCLMTAMDADPHAALDLIDKVFADRRITISSAAEADHRLAAMDDARAWLEGLP